MKQSPMFLVCGTCITFLCLMTLPWSLNGECTGACSCQFKSGFNYSLDGFAKEVAIAIDAVGNTYSYLPCGSVPCGNQESNVAVCQTTYNTSPSPQYSCGDSKTVEWSELPDGGKGFSLIFTNGDYGRRTTMDFYCEKGVNSFSVEVPTEAPLKNYHLQWKSSNACPITSN